MPGDGSHKLGFTVRPHARLKLFEWDPAAVDDDQCVDDVLHDLCKIHLSPTTV